MKTLLCYLDNSNLNAEFGGNNLWWGQEIKTGQMLLRPWQLD